MGAMLSGRTLHELTAERQALERQRQSLEERLKAISLILNEATTTTVDGRRSRAPRKTTATTGAGFRHQLLQILAQGPASPAEAIRAVVNSGFQIQGKTPIETRVYNELARLRKEGLIRKNRGGRYLLKQTA